MQERTRSPVAGMGDNMTSSFHIFCCFRPLVDLAAGLDGDLHLKCHIFLYGMILSVKSEKKGFYVYEIVNLVYKIDRFGQDVGDLSRSAVQ